MPVSKTFTHADQARFAALSGDINPLHMDALAARRSIAGAPVVHGIHVLLWLVGGVCAGQSVPTQIGSLEFRFRRMIYIGDTVEARLEQRTALSLTAGAYVGSTRVLSLSMQFAAPRPAGESAINHAAAVPASLMQASALLIGQMQERAGIISCSTPLSAYCDAFPQAAAALGVQRVAVLCCSSYLVGMVVPGLYSIYQAARLRLVRHEAADPTHLRYNVTAVDARFGRVLINIDGPGITGSLTTAVRAPPVEQPSTRALAQRIGPVSCRGSVALIIGGSRGLGEATAKLIAAAGGEVIITYAQGESDAQRVAAEIEAGGGRCSLLACDVRRDAYEQLLSLPTKTSHVYYFATPTISRRRLDEFNQYYLHGFLSVVNAARRLWPDGCSIFYPSTAYIQKPPAGFAEYAMSKAAGEVVCADVARLMPELRVIVERLPRVLTDQTASFMPQNEASAVDIMLPIVSRMHQL